MKRLFIVTACMVMTAAAAFGAGEFVLQGTVLDTDGSAGGPATPNSFAYMNAYRPGIAGQVGVQDNGEELAPCISPHKIFASDGSIPAYYLSDVGSTYWSGTPAAAGQVVRVVLEVSATGNCYSGTESYAGVVTGTLAADEITAGKKDNLAAAALALIPKPLITGHTASSITIGWTGMDRDNIYGYGVYRAEAGTQVFAKIGELPQDRGNTIQYTDNDTLLEPQKYYVYAISVEFEWGGGNGAPAYFETNVRSSQSSAAGLDVPTQTYTDTPTQAPTWTATPTLTLTYSETWTPTLTRTQTYTETPTHTPTLTATDTSTATATSTVTPTLTRTPVIPTLTPTNTVIEAAQAIMAEKMVIMNNPVRNSVFRAGYMAPGKGTAVIVLYNINGELVKRFPAECNMGPNIVEKNIYGLAPGIYVVRINAAGENLPERKVAVIR